MNKLTFFEGESGDVTILDLNGDITFGEGSIDFAKRLESCRAKVKRKSTLISGQSVTLIRVKLESLSLALPQ